jgi:hypothetical protein
MKLFTLFQKGDLTGFKLIKPTELAILYAFMLLFSLTVTLQLQKLSLLSQTLYTEYKSIRDFLERWYKGIHVCAIHSAKNYVYKKYFSCLYIKKIDCEI